MPTFSNFADIEKYLKKQLPKMINNDIIADLFYEKLADKYKEFVEMYYLEYEPSVYPRSEQLKDVLPCKIVPHTVNGITTYGIDLYSNIKNLSHSEWHSGRYGGHHYGNRGNDFAELIIEDALLFGGHGFAEETNTQPLNDLRQWVSENIGIFMNMLKDELSKNGMFIVK